MYPITSYEDAALELQWYFEQAEVDGIKEPNCFMYVWEGEDAKRLCDTDVAVELVGFLEGPAVDNTYVDMETAKRLTDKFGIEFLVKEE